MCGRFSLDEAIQEWHEYFQAQIDQLTIWEPSFNIAPTMMCPVITSERSNEIQLYRWELLPSFAKEKTQKFRMFNAKAETILEKPSYKNLIKSKRCIIPTKGYYEWKQKGAKKQKYKFTTDERFTVLAGLWDYNKMFDIHSFTVITCEPNELMSNYHNRMPVILNREDQMKWLSNNITVEEAMKLLKPWEGALEAEEFAT